MDKPRLRVSFHGAPGHQPVRTWLLSLEADQRKEIGADIQTVQWRWPLGPPRVDGLGEGLYEVRSTIGGRAFRVFFCIKGDRMILLHGIEKKGQKTPKAALDLARRRMKEINR